MSSRFLPASARVGRPLAADRLLMLGVIGLAWVIALFTAIFRPAAPVHHHALPAGAASLTLGALALALVSWQVMTAAMMLPSSLPLMHLFVRASAGQRHPLAARAAFLLGYFAVWTWFAIMALAGNAALQWVVSQLALLRDRPALLGGAVLFVAGAFQFSPLKERCLRECRMPFSFLQRHYRRGAAAAWDLGLRHGLFCLGCCWALMLTMFAVGVGNLLWMAALTGVMVIEKTLPGGRRLSPVVGVVLCVWGALVLARPDLLPAAFLPA